MNENGNRARAERGEVQIGTWVTMIRTPSVLTLLRAAGLDFVRVDMEHSPFSMETAADMATLARALDFPLVVRPRADPPHASRYKLRNGQGVEKGPDARRRPAVRVERRRMPS